MLDPKLLRKDLENVVAKLYQRGFEVDRTLFLQLENKRKSLQSVTQLLQAKRNQLSKMIGVNKSKGKILKP